MIEMSWTWRLVSLVSLAAVAGCCGGGPSHKCDFTPPSKPGIDAGADGPLPCGTQICDPTQVCCVKKVPLVALCIEPQDFVPNGCEKLELPCLVPADCPAGLTCCVRLAAPAGIICVPGQLCQPDGSNTFLACSDSSQCPMLGSSCEVVGSGEGGLELKVCI
jgi:hypothetical protein